MPVTARQLETLIRLSIAMAKARMSTEVLKSDAERAIKRIEGVTRVRNKIEVLPLSPNDDRIRAAVYGRLYRTPALQKYTSNRSGPIYPRSVPFDAWSLKFPWRLAPGT